MPKPLRIIFADDHEIFRAGLRQVLAKDRNMEIIAEFSDGESVLNQIPVLKPNIVVLDLDLPKRNGLQVARELSRRRDTTPVVILTGHRDESLFEEALSIDVRGYLLKDNAAVDLLSCLSKVAAGETYLSPTFSSYLLKRGQKANELRQELRGLDALSAAERRVLRLIALSKATKDIAAELFLSPATIETHRKNICAKLELHGANKLLAFAVEHKAELL